MSEATLLEEARRCRFAVVICCSQVVRPKLQYQHKPWPRRIKYLLWRLALSEHALPALRELHEARLNTETELRGLAIFSGRSEPILLRKRRQNEIDFLFRNVLDARPEPIGAVVAVYPRAKTLPNVGKALESEGISDAMQRWQ